MESPMTDPTYDDQFDDAYEAGEGPLADYEEQAETHARCLRYWQQQQEDITARFDLEIARLMDRAAQTAEKLAKRVAWHESGLQAYYRARGEKRLVLANATLSSTKGRQRIEVEDLDALEAWAVREGREEVLRVKVDADRAAIMEIVKATGEEPAGCRIERGEDTFKVKF
jgi:phage host-nuclease inhibitor protein Gam